MGRPPARRLPCGLPDLPAERPHALQRPGPRLRIQKPRLRAPRADHHCGVGPAVPTGHHQRDPAVARHEGHCRGIRQSAHRQARLSHRRRRVAARAVAARRRLRRDGRPAHDDARLRALRRAAPDGLAGAKRPRRRPGAPGDLARDAAAGDDLAAQRPREKPRRRTDALRRRLRPAVDARPPGRGERRPQWRIVRLRQQFRILPRPRRRGDLLCQSHLRRHRRRQRPGRCHAPRKDPPAAALGARLLDPPDARGPDRHS